MNNIKSCAAVLAITLFLVSPALNASDFGLMLDQYANAGGISDETDFEYTATLVPRFAVALTNSLDFFISAGATFKYTTAYADDKVSLLPELYRTEISGSFNNLSFKAGRIQYADPVSFITDGLFDGAQIFFDTAAGTFSAGAWYTGFQYKQKNSVTMTAEDQAAYASLLDYDNFVDTYFASRRLLAALGWEHPAVAELVRLKLAVTGQFDFNDYNDNYIPFHSQYISVKADIPVSRFVFDLGGSMQLAQADDEFGVAFAGEIGFSWAPPAAFRSQLSFIGRFANGRSDNNDTFIAFVPITTQDQGNILKTKLSGISLLSLDYTARIHQTLASSLTASCFIRSDLGTYAGYPAYISNGSGYVLGCELYGNIVWSPLSDLYMNLGGGVFLPSMGNAAPDGDPLWRVQLSMVIALY